MNLQVYDVDIMPLTANDGRGFAAIGPELAGCRSHGDTPQEALAKADDAVQSWIKAAQDMGQTVSVPRRVAA